MSLEDELRAIVLTGKDIKEIKSYCCDTIRFLKNFDDSEVKEDTVCCHLLSAWLR